MDNLEQVVEAIIFSAGNVITKKDILSKLPEDVKRKDLNKAIRRLSKKYSGKAGIHLTVMENDVQFTSNPDYGDIVADVLRVTKEKELSKVLLEVLSIIAYMGPITKTQIEDIRNTNSEYAVSALCRFDLIYPCGRADTLGRPTLYKTTHKFLQKFGLKSLKDLPDKEEVLKRLKDLNPVEKSDSLFREIDTDNLDDILQEDDDIDDRIEAAKRDFVDVYMNTDEIPDFLDGEEVDVIGDEEAAIADYSEDEEDEDLDAADDFEDDDYEDEEEDEQYGDETDDEDDYVETSSVFDDEDEEYGDDDESDNGEYDDSFGGGLYD
ncbi:MAG: SMC-Scp complex subunit ScpB [Clostridia bacterium]|nr:SMC-Scp complex subunit ScpB [Clostridia bacterium]MCX4366612.1 SMC-Scp complex subunit ScpB [Clostridia bacterium]